jgi:cytochrome c oxidase assembly protein subunit 15
VDVPSAAFLPSAGQRRFRHFASFLLVFLLGVIVFGAWVRITGSGAGCGEHWPSCHGQLVPRTPTQATVIEYTHRLTSGLLGFLALALPIWAWQRFPPGHAVRRFSLGTFALVVVEAGIGAGLVKNRLVVDDASVARAVVVALHLVNTLLLTGCAALTIAVASQPSSAARALGAGSRRAVGPAASRLGTAASVGNSAASLVSAVPLWAFGVVLFGLCAVAASGAVTALGDTLFPVALAASEPSGAPAQHFLVQLRVVHPILASLVVCASFALARALAPAPETRAWAIALGGLSCLQLVLGALNVLWRAPGWLQLVHLLMAQLLWISAVMLTQKSRTRHL